MTVLRAFAAERQSADTAASPTAPAPVAAGEADRGRLLLAAAQHRAHHFLSPRRPPRALQVSGRPASERLQVRLRPAAVLL